jgi:23S rRNA pseudouridine1911/1915/1917 synthase
MKRIQVKVQADSNGMRLDLFLVKADIGLSRRKIRQIIDIGGAYQNRKRVRMASRQVNAGDELLLEFHPESLVITKTKNIDLTAVDIIFEDDNLFAINKPPAMPSQATRSQSVFHVEVCLKKLLEQMGRKAGKLLICHRLDKETTGIILIARSTKAVEFVMDQFREKTIKKTYWALCRGVPAAKEWKVENFLSAIDKKTGMVRSVRAGGKPSVTRFKALQINKEFNISLIECYPETGRSHQIRVHLAEFGLPILGDKKYGGTQHTSVNPQITEIAAVHHMLHAKVLKFRTLDDKGSKVLNADLPATFQKLLELLGFREV